ncbi:polar amino acid transport system ATP-binding protein [Burkholderia sp. GAS332]|nr:polar amino acid transport system ATP-binding protein [Burkholderia sp. GAS332]
MEVLKIEGLHKSFGSFEVLKGIDLTVKKSDTIVLLGSSGSGKSTLLRCLNFLEIPNAGVITHNGKPIGRPSSKGRQYSAKELREVRSQVGMVFQQFNLFPHLTVENNVALGLIRVRKMSPAAARKRALESLDRVGLASKANMFPGSLSGGQQQRVAIARAIAMQPSVVLFDEPTSALDPELVGEVLNSMKQLAEDGTTMIVVTHELGFAYNVANCVVFLHEGQVHEMGPPQEVLVRPKTPRMREFLTSHTLFRIPEPADPAGCMESVAVPSFINRT